MQSDDAENDAVRLVKALTDALVAMMIGLCVMITLFVQGPHMPTQRGLSGHCVNIIDPIVPQALWSNNVTIVKGCNLSIT